MESGVCRSRGGAAWMEFNNQGNELEVIKQGEVIGEAWPTKVIRELPAEDHEKVVVIQLEDEGRCAKVKELLDLSAPAFSAEGRKKLEDLAERYHKAFAASDEEFGKTTVTEHVIDTGDARPIKQPARPVPVPMRPEVKKLFVVLPFGLSTSPACFNRMMQEVFGDLIGKSIFVYLDDILLATETEEEHLSLLEEILKRVIKYGLMFKPKKCEIGKQELCYLGHVISERGVELGKDKVDKVKNFPVPKTVTQVRQFIGLASYHRKFIQGFSVIASPLVALTRKDTKFCWGDSEQAAFDTLKEKLISAPILAQPDYEAAIGGSKPFIIWTDACKTGIGAVLTQEGIDGRPHPLFYVSKACSEAERNYSITQLEALAVVVAMRKLRTFIMGAKVIIRTDHQPLLGLFKGANLSSQLVRWALELQEYRNVKLEFVKGKANTVADALSRCYSSSDFGEHVEVMDSVICTVQEQHENWFEMLKTEESWAEICEKVAKEGRVLNGRNIFGRTNDCLVKIEKLGLQRKVVPMEKRKALWEEVHCGKLGGHFGAKKLKQILSDRYFWPGMGKDIGEWTQSCMKCFAHRSHRRDRPPLCSIKTEFPMQIVGMDLAEMPMSEEGYKYILVIIDHFTKFAAAWPLKTKTAEEVASRFLENWCLREQRFPYHIISDMGLEFDNKLMERVTELTGIKSVFSCGYNSQFNGLSERFIQTLKKVLAKRVNTAPEWSSAIPFALFAYNTAPHTATGETPHFVLHGYDAVIPRDIDPTAKPTVYQADIDEYKHHVLENLHACQEIVKEKLEKYRVAMEKEYNGRRLTGETQIRVTDLVYVELPTERAKNALSKLASRWEGPARVIEVGKTHTKVKFLQGNIIKEIHLSQVVKWTGKESEAQVLKGTTTRKTRNRRNVNLVNFSKVIDAEQ
uniref:Integrase catalytic domain-containing protein n=1 Tax=Panagrolaimus sp. PS1159 TaxID=55785 RepID=A0AC35F203_9BILA